MNTKNARSICAIMEGKRKTGADICRNAGLQYVNPYGLFWCVFILPCRRILATLQHSQGVENLCATYFFRQR